MLRYYGKLGFMKLFKSFFVWLLSVRFVFDPLIKSKFIFDFCFKRYSTSDFIISFFSYTLLCFSLYSDVSLTLLYYSLYASLAFALHSGSSLFLPYRFFCDILCEYLAQHSGSGHVSCFFPSLIL